MKCGTLPKSVTTVTAFSKLVALIMFILLPFIGFWLGVKYEKELLNVCSNNIGVRLEGH